MPAPRSRRGQILLNLQAQLAKISVANGYTIDVKNVTQDLKNWTDTPEAETPVIYIIDNSTVPKYHPGKLLDWEWSVSLFAVMKNRSQAQMEELISDIMECLYKNVTLADDSGARTISHMRIENIVTDGQFFSQHEGSQLFRIDLQLIYTSCIDAIR
jgi:hypothetical protein